MEAPAPPPATSEPQHHAKMISERTNPASESSSNQENNRKFSVSFRDDVVFGASGRSAVSLSSFESSGSSSGYSKLRSSLTREQTNRDPFFFYQVTRNLGSGSMGDVRLVKKRADRIGGSARRNIQKAVERQKREEECLKIPVVGTLFEFCMDADLKVDAEDRDILASSRHSIASLLGKKEDPALISARSFEDSLLREDAKKDKEIIYAMKSILLSQVTQKEFVDELRNEIAILKDLDHPNIVRAIETFEYMGKISIVMEVCTGGDLYSRDPYTELEAARIITSILSAIAYMHSRNVAHRDLKYENGKRHRPVYV